MPGSSFFALFDDIAALLDDIALMSKVAARKTAGVLGDDLALNAQQVSGVNPDRELPVVWAVAKGSLVNKLILVPGALLVSTFLPIVVTPLLMIGGAFLCFEGCEKILHAWLHREEAEAERREHCRAAIDTSVDLAALERGKIKAAVRTDFVLSAEIIVIALGTLVDASSSVRVAVLCTVALGMTVGVYGVVAGIVKIDDAGLWLSARGRQPGGFTLQLRLGRFLVAVAPSLMRFLSVAGTLAMFLVGGGILVHGIAPLHHLQALVPAWVSAWALAAMWSVLLPMLLDAGVGLLAGLFLVGIFTGVKRLQLAGRATRD
jgi:predicted DNA repair protein MutK